jgi:esterase/lipase
MNLERFDDEEGEVNEFLLDGGNNKSKVLLIHGIAGTSKSISAKKIEEFFMEIA